MISRLPKYAAHISFERGIRGCPEAAQRVANKRAGAEISYTSKEVTGGWIVHQHPEPPSKGKGIAIYVYMLALLTDEGIEQLADMVAESVCLVAASPALSRISETVRARTAVITSASSQPAATARDTSLAICGSNASTHASSRSSSPVEPDGGGDTKFRFGWLGITPPLQRAVLR